MGSATGNAASFGLSALGQIAVAVSDVDRSAAFYRDAVGLQPLFQFPGLAFFDCEGVRLMLSASEAVAPQGSFTIYFKVPDIRQAYDALCGRSVQFEGKPHVVASLPDHDLWMTFFRDPDGNLLALMSEVPRA